ncbi:hypothetical protein [Actinoplanes sp. NPDC049599]|uniref:hypothetical protein n=1 Tax=Actinoplanes sp. NPDC049599 TaxID=3363903 RepID=UPI0037941C84
MVSTLGHNLFPHMSPRQAEPERGLLFVWVVGELEPELSVDLGAVGIIRPHRRPLSSEPTPPLSGTLNCAARGDGPGVVLVLTTAGRLDIPIMVLEPATEWWCRRP